MQTRSIQFLHPTHQSPEFDEAYEVISRDIPPEYIETKDFLRNRVRVRDERPKTGKEKLLLQDGYTLHLIAARQDDKIVGTIYGHLISKITSENKAVGFVTYLAVHPEFRRCGIGTGLINELQRVVEQDSLRMTGRSIFGMVYEIEEEGKEKIKATVRKLGAKPLDIVYFQPALRPGYQPERMNLWFQPITSLSPGQATPFVLSPDIIHDVVRNILVMEYVGPEIRGFDLNSKPYTAFLESLNKLKTERHA